MLALDHLTFAHPGQEEPYVLTMQALPGEITAVTGPSGSGKSTLLDLIAGFLTPQSGNIMLDGKDITGLPPEERPVSILFQSELLFEHLSASANVALGLPRNADDRHRAIADALSAVGLDGLGEQKSATLSGGQKQRVALARTLLRNQPILLLDEPFSALDDISRANARDLVRTLTAERGWHTILVTHHGEDVSALATRHYQIKGKVLELDPAPLAPGQTPSS